MELKILGRWGYARHPGALHGRGICPEEFRGTLVKHLVALAYDNENDSEDRNERSRRYLIP